LRIEMYQTALKRLKVPTGVCKETKDVVRLLGLNQICNCTL
jgi:ribosomal protein L30/L7E